MGVEPGAGTAPSGSGNPRTAVVLDGPELPPSRDDRPGHRGTGAARPEQSDGRATGSSIDLVVWERQHACAEPGTGACAAAVAALPRALSTAP